MDPVSSAPDGELLGSMLIGVVGALRNTQAIPATRTAQLLEGVESDAWYPMSRFFAVVDEIRRYDVDADPIFFRAGVAFAEDWYARFDGRTVFPSAQAFIEAQRRGGGYSRVHRGAADKIGWLDVVDFDAAGGRALLECVTPYPREFERGLMHGGVLQAGDVDYVRVESLEEPYKGHLTRKMLTIVYHRKPDRETAEALDRLLAAATPAARVALPAHLHEAAAWRLRSLAEQAETDRLYYRQSDLLLAKTGEELVRAKQQAEAANLAKSQFLATMSHEMRTPLHVIVGLCHLMRNDLETPAQLERLDRLAASSDHLLAIINDVLDLSKIEAGELVLDRADFVLGNVIDKVVRMVEQRATEKGLSLAVQAAPDAMAIALNGDALRLAQVLINLCGNAVKFTDRGGVILRADASATDDGRVALHFAVEDSGIGIAAHDRQRLFKPFSQLDASTTRSQGGTGLGLTISQRLVAMMGGAIQVASSPGMGSCFSFDILVPRGAPLDAEVPAGGAHGAPASFAGASVLLADDHPVAREMVTEMIERLGCRVDVAANGSEAVERASARRYDAILMDVQMPRMDGLAATRAIRMLAAHGGTPVIALTANAFAEDRQRCLDAGMSGHLAKPVTPAALAATLGRWLRGGAPAPDENPVADGGGESGGSDETPDFEVPEIWAGSSAGREHYREQLMRFAAFHGGDMERLRQLRAAGDADAAHALVHRLKGAAGALGIRRLASLTTELDRALCSEAGDTIVGYLIELCHAELEGMAVAEESPARFSAALRSA